MTNPKRYNISALLMNGAQPFKNLDAETREYLAHTIAAHGNLRKMPVLLSADHILYDGHQRLMALADTGRKQIGAGEFIINPKIVGRESAYMEAIRANQNRRHLTGKMKAAAMWNMVRDFKVSQNAIGKIFGMRQQSVSELMRKYPPADIDSLPDETIGEDGRAYRRQDVTAKDDHPSPYEYRQRVKKHLVKVSTQVSHLVTDAQMCGDFGTFEDRDGVVSTIAGIIGALATVSDQIGGWR